MNEVYLVYVGYRPLTLYHPPTKQERNEVYFFEPTVRERFLNVWVCVDCQASVSSYSHYIQLLTTNSTWSKGGEVQSNFTHDWNLE